MNIKKQLVNLWNNISLKRKKELALLIVTIFISSLAEVIGLGAVIPFLGVLTNPEKLYNLDILKPFFSFFSIQNSKDLLLPITIFFSTTIIFSGIMRFISLWLQTKLSFAIGADISTSIYEKTLFQSYTVHVSRNSSEIISSISTKVNTVISYVIMPFVTIINSIFMFFMIIGFLTKNK